MFFRFKYPFMLHLSANDGATAGGIAEDNTDAQGQGAGADPDKQKEEKTFSQQDVNNIVARESKSATEKMLRDLGVDNFDNAKDGLQKFKEWQEAQKTEAEKQAEALTQAEAENKSLKAQAEALEAKLTALGAGVDPQYIDEVILLAQAQVNDDTDIAQAIEAVVAKFPTFTVTAKAQEPQKKPSFAKAGNNHIDNEPVDVWANLNAKYKK